MEGRIWSIGEDLKETQRVILLYGSSGSGKTTLASQFPNPLFLSCDPGQLGGALSAVIYNPKVKIVRVQSYEHFNKALLEVKKYTEEFDTLVIDSISYLQRIVMTSILSVVGREMPRFEEWNLLVERMRKIINAVAEFPTRHIIFTAVDDLSKDETTGKIYGGPNLPGKLSKELPQACDVVLRLYVTTTYNKEGKKEVVYKYQCTPDDVWFAKDRTGLLPPEGIVATSTGKNEIVNKFNETIGKIIL